MYMTTAGGGLWYSSNGQSALPSFSQVQEYSFSTPERVFFNPFDPREVWVASFGNGLRVGVQPWTPGDADGDGAVNVFDLAALASNYGLTGKLWRDGDFTGDGVVNVFDLSILANHYGTTAGGGGVASSVMNSPQPTVVETPLSKGISEDGEGHVGRNQPAAARPVELIEEAAVALLRMPMLSAGGQLRLGPHSEWVQDEATLQHWRRWQEPRREVDGEPVDLLSQLQLPSLLVRPLGGN